MNQEFTTSAKFFRHNQELIATVKRLEAKSRRLDLLVGDDAIQAFYEARVAPGIYNGPMFELWLREINVQDPKRLHMRLGDLLQPDAELVGSDLFPDYLEVSGTPISLEYRFEPGHPEDGITLITPLALVNQIPVWRCEWLVPGLMETLVTILLRGLPKVYRKIFMPIPDTANRLAQRLTPMDRPLLQGIGDVLFKLTGTQVPENAWDLAALPDYLRMGFRIIDDSGRILAWSKDFSSLRRAYGDQGRKEFSSIKSDWLERDGITRWDFGILPEAVRLERCGISIQGYPALIDQGSSVALKIMDAQERAVDVTRAGLRRLALLQLPTEARQIRKGLTGLPSMRLHYAQAPGTGENDGDLASLEEELIARIVDRAIFTEQPLPRNVDDFAACVATGRAKLGSTAKEVCQLAKELLALAHDLRLRIYALTQSHWQLSAKDMQSQLDGLIYRGFLRETADVNLQQYPRYLSALATRLERLPGNTTRDKQWVLDLTPLLTEWQQRCANARAADKYDVRLEKIRWMFEELRISLFAQPQPTAYPISIKRLERSWRELGF